ncbi:DUF4097 domain-containing protein [Priestia megaterium]|nr:DUF4097 domain-containing protein [Priestia megaterium]
MNDKRKQILEMVEQGKLTVDEALTLLNSLDNSKQTVTSKSKSATELTPYVGEPHNQSDSMQTEQTSFKDKLFTFVDQTVKKVKEFDLDFNFGPSIDVQHIFQQTEAYIQTIEIDVANGSVQLKPWGSPDIRIECQASVYKVENPDEARQTFLKHVSFSIENGKLRFNVQQKQMKVKAVIYVPETDYERIHIRVFNGPIEGERLNVQELKAKTANGLVHFHEVNSSQMEVETSNGHIELSHIFSSKCELETINGSIKFDGDCKKIDVQTFNGDIEAYLNGERVEVAFLKTTTGNIDLYTPSHLAVDGELKSNLGKFKCTLAQMEVIEEKKETVIKQLRFRGNTASPKSYKLLAESKAGSITIQ